MADITGRFLQLKAMIPLLVGQNWESRIAADAQGVLWLSVRGSAYSVFAAQIASSLLTDSSPTVVVTTASEFTLPATTLTTNRTVTLGTAGAFAGEVIRVIRLDKTAFTLAIANGGGGGGTLLTMPVSAGRLADFVFDGTNWALSGVVRLA